MRSVFMIAVASALEVLQQLVPGRHGHIRDLVFKIGGMRLGLQSLSHSRSC
jgi:hypothetical protein